MCHDDIRLVATLAQLDRGPGEALPVDNRLLKPGYVVMDVFRWLAVCVELDDRQLIADGPPASGSRMSRPSLSSRAKSRKRRTAQGNWYG